MASALAIRILRRSISRVDAAPSPMRMAPARIRRARRSRRSIGRTFLSRTPGMRRIPGGKTTAAATTGPASGPRPTSSIPTSSRCSAQAIFSRLRVGRGGAAGLTGLLLFLLPDPRALARERVEIVEVGAAHPAPAHPLDRADRRAVQRENPLYADAGRELAHREGLVHTATPPADDHAFERLEALLIALANPDDHVHGVTGRKLRVVRPQALTGDCLHSLHGRLLLRNASGPRDRACAAQSTAPLRAAATPRCPRGCPNAAPRAPRGRDTPAAGYSSAGSKARRNANRRSPTGDRPGHRGAAG